MLEVRFYDKIEDSQLDFAVIIARTGEKWVFCKHKERDTYEVPGGHREAGETIEEAAKRELKEETGFTAEQLMFVTKTCLAIGTSNEMTYVYIATGLTHGEQMPDREEFIKLEKYSLEDTMQMIEDGKIIDSKTLIAIYAYANHVLKKQIRQGI